MTQTSVNLFLPLLLQVVHGVSPVLINLLNIVISLRLDHRHVLGVGLVGAARAGRVGVRSGHRLYRARGLTLVALLPALCCWRASALLMGIGIGIYNVHLVARAMATAGAGSSAAPRRR